MKFKVSNSCWPKMWSKMNSFWTLRDGENQPQTQYHKNAVVDVILEEKYVVPCKYFPQLKPWYSFT